MAAPPHPLRDEKQHYLSRNYHSRDAQTVRPCYFFIGNIVQTSNILQCDQPLIPHLMGNDTSLKDERKSP